MATPRVGFSITAAFRTASTFTFCWLLAGAATASAQAPQIVIAEPAEGQLGQPNLRVRASCVDDSPCVLKVGTDAAWLAMGQGSIDALIRPPDGAVRLRFLATDSTNLTTELFRNVFVNSSARQHLSATFPGQILDIDDTRALAYDESVTPIVLRLVDRAANTSQVIWSASPTELRVYGAWLIPGGALFTYDKTASALGWLREWREGVATELGSITGRPAIEGPWAAYEEFTMTGPHSGDVVFVLRNVLTGARTVIDSEPIHYGYDVTSNGRVVFSGEPPPPSGSPRAQLYMFEPGPPPSTTALTSDTGFRHEYPVTGGGNIVFMRREASVSAQTTSIVLRQENGTEAVLAEFSPPLVGNEQPYLVAGGWIAFLKPIPDGSGKKELWLRAPDGTLRQIGADKPSNALQALSDTGEVIFDAHSFLAGSGPGTGTSSQRYLARTDGSELPLGPPVGKVVRIDGDWYAIAGRSLLSMDADVPSRAILAEGATGTFFSTDVALLNPHETAVPVTIRYLREGASEFQETRTLPARSRETIHLDEIPELDGTSVSTVVESPAAAPIVAERLMTWDATGYGAHLGSAVDHPRERWYFAEGAQGFFYTYFLIANSSSAEATVTFTFLLEQGAPVTRTIAVAAGTRRTLYAGEIAELVNASFATIVDADVPIVAERAMYFGESPLWLGGHGSAGVPEPSYQWFHAEGATGELFDTFILLANPHPVDVPVTMFYTTDQGVKVTREHTLPARSRLTINIETEAPELANTAVSTRVMTNYTIVSERAMYWGTTGTGWREAHNSFGATVQGVKWGLAEGRSGGARGYQTYVLVSNGFMDTAQLRVTFLREDGEAIERTFTMAPNERLNIATSGIAELNDSNFATIVESINNAAITVESAIYWNVNGVIWETGGNTIGTLLR